MIGSIGNNLHEVNDRIKSACHRVGREVSSVELIAVSKTFPAEAIREASESGQTLFGESKLQEAEPKISLLPEKLCWHFIGRVQTNKVRKILPLFHVIHAVDSLRLAGYMEGIAEEMGLFPKIFLQVNLAEEITKGGFDSASIESQMDDLLNLRRLGILGLMMVPPTGPDGESSRKWFVALRTLRDRLEEKFSVSLPGLSMGMSGDYEIAIEEGATHVRVGSSIFGNRKYRVEGEIG